LPKGNSVTRCPIALSDVETKHAELSAVGNCARGHTKPSAIASAVPIKELTKAKGGRTRVVRIDATSRLARDNPSLRGVGPSASLRLVDAMLLLWLELRFVNMALRWVRSYEMNRLLFG
jgi:hypothetical protein